MKVALACSGLGRVQRGFERLTLDLHRLLREDVDMTLFKGGGSAGPDERVVWNASRHGVVNGLIPLHALTDRSPYFYECITFATAMVPHLLRHRYDIVHTIDLYVAKALHRIRRLVRGRFRLLYTQGVRIAPRYYPPTDHIHQIAQGLWEEALECGVPGDRMTLVPCGVHTAAFEPRASRSELRRRYGVPDDSFVILSVSAINRVQKRIDYVIDEAARLDGPCLLWLDGQPEDASLIATARARLPNRCRISRVPSHAVRDLYGLSDVFVLGSLQESFGIAAVEAMASGLPVITHDSSHFQWLVEDPTALVDASRTGALSAMLRRLQRAPDLRRRLGQRNRESARRRFDWDSLKDDYLAMYRRLVDGGSPYRDD